MRSLAPGKILLAGEYAVIDGGVALVLAINRFATATIEDKEQQLSPFLQAARARITERFGTNSSESLAAARVRVDTSSFRQGGCKLGLGSSAAATVAAVGAALGTAATQETIHDLARLAHGDAQEASGTRGSGADVASASFGGCLQFSLCNQRPYVVPVTLPPELHLVFPWCGQAASTTSLVPQVKRLRESSASSYEQHCQRISDCARDLCKSSNAAQAIDAVRRGGSAVAALGRAAQVPLWLPIHTQMREVAIKLGGALKPTGAGGGDLALGAFPSLQSAHLFSERLQALGILCPQLSQALQGVCLERQASKVEE